MEKTMTIDPALVNEWHAVLSSQELKDKPIQVNVMGELIVIFRSSKGIHAFKDLCVHRGSVLSLGKVENDTIECPYHAWKYDVSGNCVCIPSQSPEEKISSHAKAIVYSCKEEYGLIWVCTGTPEPFPVYEEFHDPEFRSITWGPVTVNASAPRVIENFIDYSHLMFVHEGILGVREHSKIEDYKVRMTEQGLVTDEVEIFESNAQWGGDATSIYVKRVLRPTTASLTKVNTVSGERIAILIHALPVKTTQTKVYQIVTRDFDLDEKYDQKQQEINDLIFEQDIAILENQKPEQLPLDLQAELNHKSDRLSIEYRRWLKKLGVQFGTA